MSVATVQFRGQALGRLTSYQAILPEIGDGPFPVLFQLHGLHDDASVFRHAEQAARGTPQVIAFDCGVDDEGLIDDNRELHALMERLGLLHPSAEHYAEGAPRPHPGVPG